MNRVHRIFLSFASAPMRASEITHRPPEHSLRGTEALTASCGGRDTANSRKNRERGLSAPAPEQPDTSAGFDVPHLHGAILCQRGQMASTGRPRNVENARQTNT